MAAHQLDRVPVIWTLVCVAVVTSQIPPNFDAGLVEVMKGLQTIFSEANQGQMSSLKAVQGGQQGSTAVLSNDQGQRSQLFNLQNLDLQSLLGFGTGLRDLLVGSPSTNGPTMPTEDGPTMSAGSGGVETNISEGAGLSGAPKLLPLLGGGLALDGKVIGSGQQSAGFEPSLGAVLSDSLAPSNSSSNGSTGSPSSPSAPLPSLASSGTRRFVFAPAPNSTSSPTPLWGLLRLLPAGSAGQDVAGIAQQAWGLLNEPGVQQQLGGLLDPNANGQSNHVVRQVLEVARHTAVGALAGKTFGDKWATFVPPGAQVSRWKRTVSAETVVETAFVWDSLVASVAVVRSLDPALLKVGFTQSATLLDFNDTEAIVAVRTGLAGAEDACYLLPAVRYTVKQATTIITNRNDTLLPTADISLNLSVTTPPLDSAQRNELFMTYPSLMIFCEDVTVVRARPTAQDSGSGIKETEKLVKVVSLEAEINILVPKTAATGSPNGVSTLHKLIRNISTILG